MMEKKGIKNITFGLLNQIITIAFGLILPRLFITTYGSEVNGLISSVNQLFVYVALLEAGIGTASLQALYRTIAAEDRQATNEVLSATNYFYKRTGIYYLIAVVALSVGYPLVVKSDIPFLTVFLVILLNGLGGVVNYFFQGKFRILLRAEGKNYVLSNLSTATYIITNIAKIVLIGLGFDIIVIQFVYFLINVIQMAYILWYIRKNYSWIDLSVKPNKEAIASKNAVIVHQVSDLIFSNTDVLTLTFFCGLKTVSVYSLYNSFFSMVKSVLYCFLDGLQYAMGQTYHADFEKFKKLQDQFEASYMVLTFMFYSMLYVVITPFIFIYTKGITDINYVDQLIPLLFTLVFLLQGARGPMQLVTNYAEHFKETRSQAIIEMIINIVVSIAAVIKFGIYGVLIGTIAALIYRANAIIIYVNKKILFRSPFVTYKRWGWCMLIFIFVYFANRHIFFGVESYIDVIMFLVPSCMAIAILYGLGMFIFERNAFKVLIENVKTQLPFLRK